MTFTKTANPTTFRNVGDVINYTYTIVNSGTEGIGGLAVTDDRVNNVNCPPAFPPLESGQTRVCTGSYTITADDVRACSVTNNAIASGIADFDPDFIERRAQATVTIIECEEAFDPRRQTRAVIERFMYHRLVAILDDEPDRPRFIRRFPGSLWGGDTNGNTPPFSIASSGQGNRIAFSTSLSQMRQALASAEPAIDENAMTLGSPALYERPGPVPYRGIDIWTEGHFASYDDTGGTDGSFDILYVGADYALNNNWIVGVLGQFDWVDETTRADGSKAEGEGWMVGPYISGRLSENLFFDSRAAWGSADNSVSPIGTFTDDFDSDRWLAMARLTGNWTSGNWRLTPSALIKYGEESQDAYTDSLGFRITGQDVSLGRIEFGPEFGYRWLLADGTLIEPHVALFGVWNFEGSSRLFVNNAFFAPDDFTGRLEGGALVQLPKGISFRGAAAYDGIGSNGYNAVTGKVWLNIPLN